MEENQFETDIEAFSQLAYLVQKTWSRYSNLQTTPAIHEGNALYMVLMQQAYR